jgi:hypothetical protein
MREKRAEMDPRCDKCMEIDQIFNPSGDTPRKSC